MVFAVRIKADGSATFTNAWVRTLRFHIENAAQGPVVPKMGDMHGLGGVALMALQGAKMCVASSKQRSTHASPADARCACACLSSRRKLAGLSMTATPSPMGTANTALEFHAGRLLALNEGDVPWTLRALCDGALQTLGPCTFNGAVATRTFTAHPKTDHATGELLYFSYNVSRAPYLTFGVLDAAGAATHTTAVPLRFPQMVHDFAITASYAVFWDLPLVFDPQAMVQRNTLPFVFDKPRGARFGLLPRRGEGATDMRWFDLPGCMIFHSLAAWEEEEGQLVRLFACRMDNFSLSLDSRVHELGAVDTGSPELYEFTLDVRTGEAEQRLVVPLPDGITGAEFPRAHPALTGRKVRYGYVSLWKGMLIVGLAKVDLQKSAIVGRIDYPAGHCGSEATFVPMRAGVPSEAQEDAGWLLSYVSTESSTALWIMDAKAMAPAPLAVLPLPTRAPWGFHGQWLTDAQLAAQQTGA